MQFHFFKKKKESFKFKFFEVHFGEEMLFGVTASSAEDAISLVCEEIFHNQTIPGLPKAKEID